MVVCLFLFSSLFFFVSGLHLFFVIVPSSSCFSSFLLVIFSLSSFLFFSLCLHPHRQHNARSTSSAAQVSPLCVFVPDHPGTGGRNGKMDPILAQFFDDDQVESDYGGTQPRCDAVMHHPITAQQLQPRRVLAQGG
jgi:hypothetical protein